ncbi:unnamed protein product, partial [Cladocopium goreaui]
MKLRSMVGQLPKKIRSPGMAPARESYGCPSHQPPEETDLLLKQKLQRWFSGDQSQLPYAARLRGLAGKARKSEVCRARLCHFERFWHRPGMEALEPDEVQRPAVNAAANAWLPGARREQKGAPRLLSDARSVAPLAPGAAVRVKLRGSDDLGICEFYEPQSGLWHVRFCDGLQRLAPQQLIRLGGNEEGDAIDGEELSQQELQQLTEEPPMKRARTRCQLVFDFKRQPRDLQEAVMMRGDLGLVHVWSIGAWIEFKDSPTQKLYRFGCYGVSNLGIYNFGVSRDTHFISVYKLAANVTSDRCARDVSDS